MCGIAGFTGSKNRSQLEHMTRALIHRGPDDEGFYEADGINLGMRRLSIIDLQTGHQPIPNEDNTIWVTLNGEIYNFQSLRPRLEAQGHRFSTHSDTEIIVHAYEAYGENFLSELNGMFGIALWDSQQKKLLIARDRLGVKPLFYYFDGNNLFYGSEIKSILRIKNFEKKINFEALSHYMTYRCVPAPLTIYKNIFSLLPGEYLTFQNGTLKKNRYWKVDYTKQTNYSEEDAKTRILESLNDAVRLRMISDVPVGAYLSGGVDSSLIVALMATQTRKKIKTFSLTYDEDLAHKKDSYYARMVSEQYGTEHYEYVMNAAELKNEIPTIMRHFDQPFNGVLATFFLSKLVNQHVKVALTGDGADDQFGSYAHHRLCWPIENYIRAKKQGLPDSAIDFRPFEGRENYVKEMAEESLEDWRIKFYAFTDAEKYHLFSPEQRENLKKFSSLELLKKNLETSKQLDSLNRLLDLDINTLLPDEILTFADRLSMAHSIELRSPFLDYRFIELIATMPGTLKIKDGIPKYILKKVAEKFLPYDLLHRPKEGFILPQDAWLHTHLKPFALETLAPDRLKMHNFFDQEAVSAYLHGYLEKKHTNSYKVWNLILFQVWYETCFLGD